MPVDISFAQNRPSLAGLWSWQAVIILVVADPGLLALSEWPCGHRNRSLMLSVPRPPGKKFVADHAWLKKTWKPPLANYKTMATAAVSSATDNGNACKRLQKELMTLMMSTYDPHALPPRSG